jgi:hypothetical protein
MSMSEQEATNEFERLMGNNFHLCRKVMEKWGALKNLNVPFWDAYKIKDMAAHKRKLFLEWCERESISKKAGQFYLSHIA